MSIHQLTEHQHQQQQQQQEKRPDFNPNPARCSFWLLPKKRFCQFEVRSGSKFCGNHLPVDEQKFSAGFTTNSSCARIPCPLNPNHTIFAYDLKKHIKVCPDARFDPTNLRYYVKGLHSWPEGGALANTSSAIPVQFDEKFSTEIVSHKHLTSEKLLSVWKIIQSVFVTYVLPDLLDDEDGKNITNEWILRSLYLANDKDKISATTSCSSSSALNWKPSNTLFHFERATQRSSVSAKHGLQHQGLVQLLRDIGAIKQNRDTDSEAASLIVELGAGKGGLALAVADAVVQEKQDPPPHFVVVDRGGFRRKADSRVGKDQHRQPQQDDECVKSSTRAIYPSFQRIRIDAQDLDLFKVPLADLKQQEESDQNTIRPTLQQRRQCRAAVIGKHLCGACTDFTISAALFSASSSASSSSVAADNGSNGNNDKANTIASVDWMMIATCCHHRCERKYFERLIERVVVREGAQGSGVKQLKHQRLLECFETLKPNEIFGPLVSLTSWATSGHVPARRRARNEGVDDTERDSENDDDDHEGDADTQKKNSDIDALQSNQTKVDDSESDDMILTVDEFMVMTSRAESRNDKLPTSPIARERAGRICKLVLDWMRCQIILLSSRDGGEWKHVKLVPFLPGGSIDENCSELAKATKENWTILAWK